MDTNLTPIETLFARVEDYGETTIELFKLNAIDKSAEIVSSLAVRLIICMVILVFALIINIGIALWVGELLGKSYYGFFIVAGSYVPIITLLYCFRHKLIKIPVSNSIISQILKPKAK
jgi:hypothetical protein